MASMNLDRKSFDVIIVHLKKNYIQMIYFKWCTVIAVPTSIASTETAARYRPHGAQLGATTLSNLIAQR